MSQILMQLHHENEVKYKKNERVQIGIH